MTRVWLHNITKLVDLKRDVDQLVAAHGENAKIEIEGAGYGRICLDVVVPFPDLNLDPATNNG